MPAFYSPSRGKCFTHFPRGILDGTDDEYEFDDDKESVSSDPAGEDIELEEDSDDDVVSEEEDTVVPDEKENISTVEVKKEIVRLEEEDLDRKPAAKTKEELEREREAAQKKREEDWGEDLIDDDLQRLLDDHMGVKRRPFKLVNLKWNNEKNKVKKVAKKRKAKKSGRASKKMVVEEEEEPSSKKRKLLTAQEKRDQEYARSLHIQELLRITRGKMA